jgi:hypothetical protein
MYQIPWKNNVLNGYVKSLIIENGIKKTPLLQPYRRSRGRGKLIKHIKSIVVSKTTMDYYMPKTGSNLSNLIEIKFDKLEQISEKYKTMLVNTRSVNNKYLSLQSLITELDFDICGLTETWLPADDPEMANLIPPNGYCISSNPRKCGRGGGVATIWKKDLCIKPTSTKYDFKTFEFQEMEFSSGSENVILFLIYRPPDSNVTEFIHELILYMEMNINRQVKTIFWGDLNINTLDKSNSDVINFNHFQECFNLYNFVNLSTHKSGSCLDICFSEDTNLVENVKQGIMFSDHHAVFFDLKCTKQKPKQNTSIIRYRPLNKINNEELESELSKLTKFDKNMNATNLASFYNETIVASLDKLAPTKTINKKENYNGEQWVDERTTREKCEMRRKERVWKRLRTKDAWDDFAKQREYYNTAVCLHVKSYYRQIFESCKDNFKELFHQANKLLFRKQQSPLPQAIDNNKLAQNFNEFFIKKVEKIIDYLGTLPTEESDSMFIESEFLTKSKFSEFKSLCENDVELLIQCLANKSCELDPLPTKLLKGNMHHVLPIITNIVNKSLLNGEFPENLKTAIVRPLLKKSNLDIDDLSNYRPVSNIPYLGKIIEKAVCEQITNAALLSGNTELYQSAYTKNCSTETALLDVMNNIYQSTSKSHVVCLVMLDLSAAFDSVSHDILLNRLHYRFGFDGKVLDWIKSYLCNRTQKVTVNGEFSSEIVIEHGVPQGSILGPFLFIFFTSPIGEICRKYGIKFHIYADDLQLYCELDPKNPNDTQTNINNLECCIAEIRAWMRVNKLKLNDMKTDVIMFGSNLNLDKLSPINIKVGDEQITPVTNVRNLGFIMSNNLSVTRHVNKVLSAGYYTLKQINRVKHRLDTDTKKILTHALITSKTDYCNSLLVGAPKKELNKLQCLQNMCARFIYGFKKHEHVSPILKDLHWLKIEYRVKYKILMLTYKCVNHSAPSYLEESIMHQHKRALRSASQAKLPIPDSLYNTKAQNSCFSQVAPRLWNELPVSLRTGCHNIEQFKKKLKTHLFNICYN